MTRSASAYPAIWRWPIAIAGLTIVGLMCALLGQYGAWLWLSWFALAAPLVLIVMLLIRSAHASG